MSVYAHDDDMRNCNQVFCDMICYMFYMLCTMSMLLSCQKTKTLYCIT